MRPYVCASWSSRLDIVLRAASRQSGEVVALVLVLRASRQSGEFVALVLGCGGLFLWEFDSVCLYVL